MVVLSSITTQHSFAQDSTKKAQLASLLTSYYDIKNALVNGDAGTAASGGAQLVKNLNEVDMHSLPEAGHNAFMAVKDKLKADAASIAATGKIEAQRVAFSSLSNTIYTLAKAAGLSDSPIYQQYCPMKKMYWLSSETAIKNPYYGKMMLTCGKVTDTLK